MNPADGGVFYFTEYALKACFQMQMRENKNNPKGSFNLCRYPERGS